MASRAFLATVVFSVCHPRVAQQPVYPSYPPPRGLGDNAAPYPAARSDGSAISPIRRSPTSRETPPTKRRRNRHHTHRITLNPGLKLDRHSPTRSRMSHHSSLIRSKAPRPIRPPDAISAGFLRAWGLWPVWRPFHTDFTFDRAMLQLAGVYGRVPAIRSSPPR